MRSIQPILECIHTISVNTQYLYFSWIKYLYRQLLYRLATNLWMSLFCVHCQVLVCPSCWHMCMAWCPFLCVEEVVVVSAEGRDVACVSTLMRTMVQSQVSNRRSLISSEKWLPLILSVNSFLCVTLQWQMHGEHSSPQVSVRAVWMGLSVV